MSTALQRSGRGKRTDKADLIKKEMQRSDGKAHQRGTVVALARWRAALVLGGKRSQATFPENNVWLHGRKQGAKEKDFQPGSIFFFFFLPPHPPQTLVPRNQTLLQALPKSNSEKQALRRAGVNVCALGYPPFYLFHMY